MENLEKIEKYLKGELDDDDLWEFKKSLHNYPQLALEVEAMRDMDVLQSQSLKIDVMDKLQAIHARKNRAQRFLGLPVRNAVAAALLILATIGGGLLLTQQGRHNQQLFEQYYSLESGAFGLRSGNTTLEKSLEQGLQFYELGDYKSAISLFDLSPDNLMARLYKGISYMELGQFDKASNEFSVILSDNDNLFLDQARWYLALSCLKTGNIADAKSHLAVIASDRSVYKTRAQKLINELENK